MKIIRMFGGVTLALLLPSLGSGQEGAGSGSEWTFTPFADAGLVHSVRDLGKTVVVQPNGQPAQLRSKLSTSPFVAAGVEIQSPMEALRIRLRGRTTVGGGAEGQILGCALISEDDAQGACDVQETDAAVRSVSAGLMFIRRPGPGLTFRPYLTADAGFRQFAFDETGCQSYLCEGHEDVLEDQTRAFLEVGLGIRIPLGPIHGSLHVADTFGKYQITPTAGAEAEGETQNALLFTFTAALPLG